MKKTLEDELRAKYTTLLMDYLKTMEEDCGLITSNSFNFPIVASDGTEGWMEITCKVSHDTEPDDGYYKRDAYQDKLQYRKEKAEKAKREKEAKIERDKKMREQKQAEREARQKT